MIRMTEHAYQLLVAGRKPKPYPMKSKVKARLKEADITKQCVQLMEAHGWKAIRLQRGLMRRRDGSVAMTIGEKGMCDWLFMKSIVGYQTGSVHAFMCEFKSPGKKPSDAQMAFMAQCRIGGLIAEWFDSYDIFSTFVRVTFGVK